MTNTALVLDIVINVGGTSNSVNQTQKIVMQSTEPHPSFSSKQPATISDLKGFRGALSSEGISGVVTTLIAIFRRQDSVCSYHLVGRK